MSTPPLPDSSSAEALARLDRLENYLREDSNNLALLGDAFEAALRCGQWERAQFHLRHAQALQPQSLSWALREAELHIARADYDEATRVLLALQALSGTPADFADAVLHNLAFIDLRCSGPAACIQRLRGRMDKPLPQQGLPSPALACLWLRALHHEGAIEEATQWAEALDAQQALAPQAAGVASLAALDADRLPQAQRWSAQALEHAGDANRPMEALVTQSSLALAASDAARAQAFANAALRLNPHDGRAWSALAFGDLLAGQTQAALVHFKNALAAMPQHIGTWHGQGWAQIVTQDLDAARQSFETALGLDRNFAESHGGLAVVLVLQSDMRAAQEQIDRALGLDPTNLSGRFAQALLEGNVRDVQSFERVARALLGGKAGPRGGTLFDTVAHAFASASTRTTA